MARRTRRTPVTRSLRLASRAGELALAVPIVVAARMARIAAAGVTPDARDRAEMVRMTSEKASAFAASWYAMGVRWHRMQVEWMLGGLHAWFDAWRFPRGVVRNLHDIANAGLAPIHRTATRNARRLSRRKR